VESSCEFGIEPTGFMKYWGCDISDFLSNGTVAVHTRISLSDSALYGNKTVSYQTKPCLSLL
jgi:hypothetical protein